jgi:general secretion pathway protein E/type IV pilus assembly protein PilB
MRLLNKSNTLLSLSELGLLPDRLILIRDLIQTPNGIILVTGPTGSGKTTTLYAVLSAINKPDINIITIEDPVEYHIAGINQVQVRNEVNMTFSAALRSMLRQAPNIIMVGEIRDKETAEIAINASLTGHMVFSTLHTNDAPSAITRLVDMGAKPFLVSAALRAVMAQRLVRRIPEKERIPYEVADWHIRALGAEYSYLRGRQFYHAGESQQAFHGRVGIFEMFAVDDSLKEVIYRNSTLSGIRKHLIGNGFRTMRYDGVQKALQGMTSIEEVLAVTPIESFKEYQQTLE